MYPKFDGLDFQQQMIDFIREKWGDVLGEHVHLLEEEGGLDKLSVMLREGTIGRLS